MKKKSYEPNFVGNKILRKIIETLVKRLGIVIMVWEIISQIVNPEDEEDEEKEEGY